MTRIGIVYVTRDGHSRALAQKIASATQSPVFEIIDKVNRKGFFRFMNAGRQSIMRVSTPIVDPGMDLSKFTHIVIVEPTWAGGAPPPVRTWISSHTTEFAGKRCALLVSNRGSEGEPIRQKFEKEFGGVLGNLVAFAVVNEKLSEEEKSRILADFLQQLNAE